MPGLQLLVRFWRCKVRKARRGRIFWLQQLRDFQSGTFPEWLEIRTVGQIRVLLFLSNFTKTCDQFFLCQSAYQIVKGLWEHQKELSHFWVTQLSLNWIFFPFTLSLWISFISQHLFLQVLTNDSGMNYEHIFANSWEIHLFTEFNVDSSEGRLCGQGLQNSSDILVLSLEDRVVRVVPSIIWSLGKSE